ncbi:HAD-IA family hydrolase [Streptomyces sp. NPDC053367]|uniref:HAD-IA family hydrolase n=1 Tax=Streptomyces sp. NPDC053367 TaxID=3365700 RepID=UPI0037D2CB70
MTATCVIFDIGGVLEITPRTGWVRRWEERPALAPGTEGERMRDVWHAGSIGAADERTVRDQAAARLGPGAARLEAFMTDLWTEYLGTPNDEPIAYARRLPGRCRLGILSNSFVGAREREAERYRFDELVERIVYSHELGIAKPDPRAYRAACASLAAPPESCPYIDDVPANVDAVRAVGMQAHLFEDNARTIARVAAHVDGRTLGP